MGLFLPLKPCELGVPWPLPEGGAVFVAAGRNSSRNSSWAAQRAPLAVVTRSPHLAFPGSLVVEEDTV